MLQAFIFYNAIINLSIKKSPVFTERPVDVLLSVNAVHLFSHTIHSTVRVPFYTLRIFHQGRQHDFSCRLRAIFAGKCPHRSSDCALRSVLPSVER